MNKLMKLFSRLKLVKLYQDHSCSRMNWPNLAMVELQ